MSINTFFEAQRAYQELADIEGEHYQAARLSEGESHLKALKRDHQVALSLTYVEGFSLADVAAAMDMSLEDAQALLTLAVTQLQHAV